jgi:copper homeostasis protein (lipoprotein)
MKSLLFAGLLLFCIAGLLFCKSSSSAKKGTASTSPDNSKTSLDWDGIYYGVLPCADCPGIQTTLYLNKDLTYRLKEKYLDRPDSAQEYTGKFNWNSAGNTITLTGFENSSRPASYFVGENTLTQLDMKGNKITGDLADRYILSKDSYALQEKYWKLTELYGKPVTVDSTFRKEPHIIFKNQDNRFNGHGGCNGFSGTYELRSGNRISISNAVTTQMACLNMEIETKFLQALQAADNFNLVGDQLVLNKARMAPLARFKTVYMRQ